MNGLYLKERRKNIGLTQEELAKRIGATRKTINSYENGASIPEAKAKLIDFILKERENMIISKPDVTICNENVTDSGQINNSNVNSMGCNVSTGADIVKQLSNQLAEKDKQIDKLIEIIISKLK